MQVGKIAGLHYDGKVAVASDTRASGQVLKSALKAGLMASGQNVIDMGSLPTSALQYYVKTHDDVRGGVMVTASHFPLDYNGFKFITADGVDDPMLHGRDVEALMAQEIPLAPWATIGELQMADGVIEDYVDAIISLVKADLIRTKNLSVCVECSGGTAAEAVIYMLNKLGVRHSIIDGGAHGEMSGGESELTAANLEYLGTTTARMECDFGVAFDTDADRCMFVTGNGKFVSGDKSLCILARQVLKNKKGKVVVSIASPTTIQRYVESNGGLVKYAPVGVTNVVMKVMDYEGVFGGEINGGYIFPRLQTCRDAVMGLAVMLEAIAENGPLADLAAEIPDCNYEVRSIECPDDLRKQVYQGLKEEFKGVPADITDGFRVNEVDGWYLVRPSETSPFFRVYSQYDDPEKAKSKVEEYSALIEKLKG